MTALSNIVVGVVVLGGAVLALPVVLFVCLPRLRRVVVKNRPADVDEPGKPF